VLTPEQTDNAAPIAAIDIPPRHAQPRGQLALATALQESRLTNLPGGDRDSAGLFQRSTSAQSGNTASISGRTCSRNTSARSAYSGSRSAR
jgi:hypothetical protein